MSKLNNIEKGKILETIVAMIEKSLSNDSNLKIIPNYKFIDSDEIEREIDVYIETNVSSRKFRIGIECKHYKSSNPITLEKIDAFILKCRKLKIDRPIFVTTSIFQSGALKRAEQENIDLIQIKKNKKSKSEISNELGIKEMKMFSRNFDFKALNALTEEKGLVEIKDNLYNSEKFNINRKQFESDLIKNNGEYFFSYLKTNNGFLIKVIIIFFRPCAGAHVHERIFFGKVIFFCYIQEYEF